MSDPAPSLYRPRPTLPPTVPLRLIAPRVLVVEDEMAVALLIEDMIAELAYETAAIVPRLEEAMEYREGDNFDLAILDVHLNGKMVFPFAAELEERDIPFLFVTAYGPRGVPEEFRHHHILQKPFGPLELRRALMDLPIAA
jgi:CheY-like chemotaxis protein